MLKRLGFPTIGEHRRFVVALAIDAIGSGVWMPFELLFFARVTDLPLSFIGGAMSAGALVGIPVSMLMGSVVDRFGPKMPLLAGQLIMAATFALSTTVSGVVGVWAVALASAAANSLFWAAFVPLVTEISVPGEREMWFGFLGALRNIGFALGGLGSGVVLTIGTLSAYFGAAWLNAASYLVSFIMLLGLVVSPRTARSPDSPKAPRQIGRVLRDRGFGWFWLSNLGYAMCCIVLNVAIPIYLVKYVGLPGWVAGVAFVINTLLVGLGQGLVVQAMTGRVRAQILHAGWAAYALGFAGLALLPRLSGPVAMITALIAIVLYTLGELIGGPVLATIAAEAPPEEARGSYSGFFQVSWNVANVVAPALFTWWLERSLMWWGAIAICAIAAVTTQLMKSQLPTARAHVTNAPH